MQFPILHYERNLIVNQAGEWWAAYQVRPWTYEYLNPGDQLVWWQRLTRLFSAVELEGQLLMAPRTIPATIPLQVLAREFRGPLAPYGAEYLAQIGQYLTGQEPAVDYETYLLFQLPKPDRGVPDPLSVATDLARQIKYWRRRVQDVQSGTPVITTATLVAYQREEEQLTARILGHIKVDRVTPAQITRLIQHRYWAGIAGPPDRSGWQPKVVETHFGSEVRLQPRVEEIIGLATGEIDLRHPRRVAIKQVVDGQVNTGYQCYLALSAIPDEMTMPGSEWAFRLQSLPFPVEVSVRWSPMAYREAIAFLRRKRLETADQVEQATSTGDIPPIDVQEAENQLDAFEQDLKERRYPALEATALFTVAASDEQELWQRVATLRDTMADLQMPLEVPAGDQHRLLHEFLPGARRQIRPTGSYAPDPPYLHRFVPEVLAAAMIGATNDVGDPAGVFIGRTGTIGRPVYVQASRGPRVNRSASAAFLGTLGGGKTFLARLLTIQTVLTQGARALLIDPKGESDHLVRHLPAALREHCNLITLSAREEDTGLLDLLAMARHGAPREAANLAVSVICFLVDARSREEQLAIHDAVEVALNSPSPSMAGVIEYLQGAGRQAGEMGRFLSHLRRAAYANLLFGDGRERSLDVHQPINILQLQHLQLPDRGKAREDMTPAEVISASIMYAVVGLASQFISVDRDVFKVVLLDEAWRVMASSTGLNVVRHLLRTGRAMNSGVYLVSQSVADLLDEGIRNNVGMRFAFRSTDQEEVEALLRFFNLDASPENMAVIRELSTGECLMQDLDGRIGVVSIDAVFEDLERAFDTRPPAPVAHETGEGFV